MRLFSHKARPQQQPPESGSTTPPTGSSLHLPPGSRIEITLEKETVSLLLTRGVSCTAPCSACGRDVVMIEANAAAAVYGVAPQEIGRWISDTGLHVHTIPAGVTYICIESLNHPPKNTIHVTRPDLP